MSLLGRLVREPLVQFMLIGAVIFAVAALTGGERQAAPRDRIVVTEGRIQQMVQIFTKTWQRPPTAQELRGLIDTHIKEEVYYREALKLGLDRDDTLIRRRMQQKMEFLAEPGDDTLTATDAELQAYLKANRSAFHVPPNIAFRQIFFNIDRTGVSSSKQVADLIKQASSTQSDAELLRMGDRTLLPHKIPLAPIHVIDRNFGQGFGQRLAQLPVNVWSGPVKSSYGLHLVHITERRAGYDPPIAEVRREVERKWRDDKRAAFRISEYERLRGKYEILMPESLRAKQSAKVTQ